MSNYGTQVKTGDKFEIQDWWVNRDLSFTPNPCYVTDVMDIVGGSSTRQVYYYFGLNKPSEKEMKELIDNVPPQFDDVKY